MAFSRLFKRFGAGKRHLKRTRKQYGGRNVYRTYVSENISLGGKRKTKTRKRK